MTRREQLLKISYTLTSCEETAEKFAAHLEELFDIVIPERIGPAFVTALQENDYAEAVKLCATYYREKAPCGVPYIHMLVKCPVVVGEKQKQRSDFTALLFENLSDFRYFPQQDLQWSYCL